MLKTVKPALLLLFCLAVFFTLIFSSGIAGQANPFVQIEEKLAGLTGEEREVVLTLFTLAGEIAELEQEEAAITREIDVISRQISLLEKSVAEAEASYNTKKEALKQVLKSYQRMGPSTYLEIILDSGSLADFLRRLNILRDITRNTGNLLDAVNVSREQLWLQRSELAEKEQLMTSTQEQLKKSLSRKIKLKEEMESYLASLAEERDFYQERLTDMQLAWSGLKPFFPEVVKEFSRVIREESLPPDAMNISLSLFGIRGTIEDKILNQIVTTHPGLPNLAFSFRAGEVEIRIPEKNLVLTGVFIILEEQALEFRAKKGSFYGIPLQAGSIEELFREHSLVLDLKPLLDGSKIRSADFLDGYMELLITPFLF